MTDRLEGVANGAGVVRGAVARGYEAVATAFAELPASNPDYAAQIAVYSSGIRVVDLWCGAGMDADSLLPIASCTKGAAYVCAAVLAQAGELDLDRTVGTYWPEFVAEGKADTTVRQLLSHQAGLVGLEEGFRLVDLYDDRLLAARLALQRPYWRPGSAHGYHGFTIGALVGELVYRITGQTLQAFYDTRIRRPRGIDLFVGLPEALDHRFVPLITPPASGSDDRLTAGSLRGVASAVPVADPIQVHNSREFRAAGPASSGGTASARGLALLYASCLDPVGVQSPVITRATAVEWAQIHSTGHDLVMGRPSRFGLGFQLPGEERPYLSARTFGHDGGGGCWGFADPRTGTAFGYTRRNVVSDRDESGALARVVQECALEAKERSR
ncbi:serine hydrolase domain-containing protein [Actinoplanes sichuanensis]|uniref:Serine hydrolase domain-containing protein n=1 Tax=Actinoplanes sichuanensis TaxID=512349 RepID=A0ABW4A5X2_9ACTN|nr:serine hydrolase domain-containing protein [Actinoplanes sichuanensis]BEL03015.1 serine hydrolase domain-containing protein [Actinoplanes sichuanensis]